MTGAMELADQLDTVEARHPNVGNNGIKAVAGDRVQRFLTVGGFGDDTAELTKPCGEDFTHVRFVIGNQYAGVLPGKLQWLWHERGHLFKVGATRYPRKSECNATE